MRKVGVPLVLVIVGIPREESVRPEWLPTAAELSTKVVAFVILAIVVLAGISALPLTTMPGTSPAVLATVTVVVLLVVALVRETGVPCVPEREPTYKFVALRSMIDCPCMINGLSWAPMDE